MHKILITNCHKLFKTALSKLNKFHRRRCLRARRKEVGGLKPPAPKFSGCNYFILFFILLAKTILLTH